MCTQGPGAHESGQVQGLEILQGHQHQAQILSCTGNLGCILKNFSVHWAPGHQVWILPLTKNREHGKAILSA